MSDDQTTDSGDSPYAANASGEVAGEAAAPSGVAPNAMRLLWAGFWAIFAAGVGFDQYYGRDRNDVRRIDWFAWSRLLQRPLCR